MKLLEVELVELKPNGYDKNKCLNLEKTLYPKDIHKRFHEIEMQKIQETQP